MKTPLMLSRKNFYTWQIGMSNTIPDLTFPSLPYGTNQVPLDLRHHLYRGISEQHSDKARV
ncbi:hypothetical protein QT728_22400, partial [Xanthomonas citri pv. citri]